MLRSARSRRQALSSPCAAASSAAKASTPCGDQLIPRFFSAARPPSRCISPPVCSRSTTPPVAVAGSWGCTLAASPGTRSSSSTAAEFLTHSNAPFRSSIAAFTFPSHNCPSSSFSKRGGDPWGRPLNSSVHNIVSEGATSTRSSLGGKSPGSRTRLESMRHRRPRPTTYAHR